MPSTIAFQGLSAMALVSFLITQSYIIANTDDHIHRMILGSLISSVTLGHLFAFNGGRGKGWAKILNTLAVMAVLSFFIMQPYIIARTIEKSHRIVLGCLLPSVLAGHIFAYFAGRSYGP